LSVFDGSSPAGLLDGMCAAARAESCAAARRLVAIGELVALRNQLPMVGAAFIAGDIDEATFRALVFRTGLVADADVLAAIDQQLALRVPLSQRAGAIGAASSPRCGPAKFCRAAGLSTMALPRYPCIAIRME
jgi:Domain of unknown function (DUF222)